MSKKTQNDIQEQEPNAQRNDFLPFAATSTANVIDQATYQTLEARTGGFVAGVAKSMQLNKVWRQSSIMAAALGQFIAESTKDDVIDDGDIAKLVAALTKAINSIAIGKVVSVNGKQGVVVLTNDDVNAPTKTGGGASGSWNIKAAALGTGAWDVDFAGDKVRFIHSGTVMATIDAGGNLTCRGDVIAFGNPT